MNSEQFIEAIRQVVEKSSTKDVLENLAETSENEHDSLRSSRAWFKNLSEKEKSNVMAIVQEAVQTAIFGFLCVLDGVRVIEDSEEKGNLKLIYELGSAEVLLNDPQDECLHDIYNVT